MNTCRSCHAEVIWARTVPGQKAVPLGTQQVPADTPGALVLVGGGWAYGVKALTERIAAREGIHPDDAAVIAEQYPRHLSHFATCPDAKTHRKGRQ